MHLKWLHPGACLGIPCCKSSSLLAGICFNSDGTIVAEFIARITFSLYSRPCCVFERTFAPEGNAGSVHAVRCPLPGGTTMEQPGDVMLVCPWPLPAVARRYELTNGSFHVVHRYVRKRRWTEAWPSRLRLAFTMPWTSNLDDYISQLGHRVYGNDWVLILKRFGGGTTNAWSLFLCVSREN